MPFHASVLFYNRYNFRTANLFYSTTDTIFALQIYFTFSPFVYNTNGHSTC